MSVQQWPTVQSCTHHFHACTFDTSCTLTHIYTYALNTFYLWIYGVRYMIKNYSGSERGNSLLPHILFFQEGIFYIHHTRDRTHTTALHQSWNTGWNHEGSIHVHTETRTYGNTYIDTRVCVYI